jgi:hypothetical protein
MKPGYLIFTHLLLHFLPLLSRWTMPVKPWLPGRIWIVR